MNGYKSARVGDKVIYSGMVNNHYKDTFTINLMVYYLVIGGMYTVKRIASYPDGVHYLLCEHKYVFPSMSFIPCYDYIIHIYGLI